MYLYFPEALNILKLLSPPPEVTLFFLFEQDSVSSMAGTDSLKVFLAFWDFLHRCSKELAQKFFAILISGKKNTATTKWSMLQNMHCTFDHLC
jgi:hypothetical protein